MKERGWIAPIVERVVGQVLDSHADQLRTEIVSRVMEEIAAEAVPDAPVPSSLRDVARAVAEIQLGTSQRDILRALLDTSSHHAARVALFVVKGSAATGWQARGFSNNDALKDFALDESAAAVARAIGERVGVSAPTADLDARFLREFGAPASASAQILPLILKDKVAALVYADSGTESGGTFDPGALELLVLTTSAWLEVNSLRKSAQKDAAHPEGQPADANHESHEASGFVPVPAVVPKTVSSFNDPFAAHSPGHAVAAAASASGGAFTPALSPPPEVATPAREAIPAAAPPPTSASPSAEDLETQLKAQRFARLLVDEIKLYHQVQVAEGRQHRDLYDRLKEVIDKSRVTYQKRYGSTAAASGNYFQHEIIRSLAEDDPSVMGANFRQ